MTDLERQPGFQFLGIRLLRVDYTADRNLLPVGTPAEIQFDYKDDVNIDQASFTIRVEQRASIRLVPKADPSKHLINLLLVVEALFRGSPDVTVPLERFAEDHAPAIAFPFLREFVTRITADSGFVPIILPPINVLALRANAKAREQLDLPSSAKAGEQ